jgi:hypothetical protein
MPSKDLVKVVEGYFRKLTDSQDVKYETLYPGIGKGAVKEKIVDDKNTFWQATLVREFKRTEVYEDVPTGAISSLAYLTQTPADDREAKARIVTKMRYFESMEGRIKEAIESQKLVRDLVDHFDLDLRKYNDGLSKDRVTLQNVDDAGTFITITNTNKAGKSPRFPLTITQKLGDGVGFVRALGTPDHEIRGILPPLEFQIEKFEKLQ